MFRPMGMSMPPQAMAGSPPPAVGAPRAPAGIQTTAPQAGPMAAGPVIGQGQGTPTGPSPQALAAALGAAQTPQGVKATPGAELSRVGMLGDLARAAGAAHRQAKPELYNSNDAFNWERAFSNPWAAEVIRG